MIEICSFLADTEAKCVFIWFPVLKQVFDCRLHGCSQIFIDAVSIIACPAFSIEFVYENLKESFIWQSEKQPYSSDSEDDGKPCSDQCYLKVFLNIYKSEEVILF